MEKREARDIIISAVVIAFVFAYSGFSISSIINFPIALIAVSLGFVLHELGHRYFARNFGCYAEFKMWRSGLGFALLFSLITGGRFVFAAPGAVVIHPRMDLWGNPVPLSKKKLGIISVSGPVMNIILALVFLLSNFFFPLYLFKWGARINLWLAIFNLLPFGPLDGLKIYSWDKRVWGSVFAFAFILFAIAMM